MVHYAESTPSAPFNQPGVPTCGFHATGSARTTITLEHYGRVGFRNGNQWVSQPPANTIGVTVQKRHKDSPCTEASWVDVTASGSFTAEMNPNSSRGIVVCGPFTDTNFYYRIRPVTTTGPGLAPLYCREVNDANPPVVGAYEYIYLPVFENIQGGCFEGEC
jgi:hypothetical protein